MKAFMMSLRAVAMVPMALGGALALACVTIIALVCTYVLRARRLGNILTTRGWGLLSSVLVYPWRLRFGMRCDGVTDTRQSLHADRPTLVIGNHPKLLDLFAYALGLGRLFLFMRRSLHPLSKKENWFLNVGLAAIGGIAIDREGADETCARIRDWALRMLDRFRNPAFVIYAEGTRRDDRITCQRVRRRLLDKYAGDEAMCRWITTITAYMLPPRPAGVHTMLAALGGRVDIVFAWTVNTAGAGTFEGLPHGPIGSVRMRFEPGTVPEGFADVETVRRWLYQAYAERLIPLLVARRASLTS